MEFLQWIKLKSALNLRDYQKFSPSPFIPLLSYTIVEFSLLGIQMHVAI